MNTCFFVSDLHGRKPLYKALLKAIKKEKPDFVFLGGDLLPNRKMNQIAKTDEESSFIPDFLFHEFNSLKESMKCDYPDIFLIPGNDDRAIIYNAVAEGEKAHLWRDLHNHCVVIGKYRFYGYGCVPPTPFRLKDWERFDMLLTTNPGCISPVDGYHSLPQGHDIKNATIYNDLQVLTKDNGLEFGVFLFHSPPFQTMLDQAAIRNENAEFPTSCLHVGSRAIRNLIEEKQPYITLHGHIHESARISGEWKQTLGCTLSISAAHDGPELSLVKFDLKDPFSVTRRLIKAPSL